MKYSHISLSSVTFITLLSATKSDLCNRNYSQYKITKTMLDFLKTKKSYENIQAAAFQKLITETQNSMILDVRTPAEHKQGGIDGAVNIDIMGSNFAQKVAALEKDKTYFVYCRSGNRSGSACEMMSKDGFKNLYNLSGGMMNWPY
ncbi:rhodanese-like domain-containing protein [Emticicia sp.]|uniref:rhodanese-like domain-containing protein n=1 Tax=Emticicia sp. TaxID=1930953 RepID=UPI0037532F88